MMSMMMDLFGLFGDASSDEDEGSMYDEFVDSVRFRDDGLRRRPLYGSQGSGGASLPPFMLFAELGRKKAGSQQIHLSDSASFSSSADIKSTQSLLNLSAKVVAKTCACEQLESFEPPLDEALLKKVAYWAFPQDEKQVQAYSSVSDKYNDWDRGVHLFTEGRIKEMWQVGFMATAYINKFSASVSNAQESGGEIRVSLTFEQQKIVSSSCSECRADVCWCPHVIAAVLYRIRRPNQVRVHAPMTETLSTLDRDQLQKLLQYAVQEDPAGILGKVFKHINDIRDSTSEINTTQGAPDPTFGGGQDVKSQWEISMDIMDKNLQADLKEMTRFRSYDYYRDSNSFYPNNYNLNDKVEARMFKYVEKALDFVHLGEISSAASILVKLSRGVMHQMKTVHQNDCPALSRFHHDLVHIYAMFMLHPKGKENTLLQNAKDLQKKSKQQGLLNRVVEFSKWAELPSLVPLYESLLPQEEKQGLFTDVLCASLTDPWPRELSDLLEGKVSVEHCKYNEDIRVMLARLESLLFLEEARDEVNVQVAKMSSCIMRRLSGAAQRNSIVGAYLKTLGRDSPVAQSLQALLSSAAQLSVPSLDPQPDPAPPRKGKGRGKGVKSKRSGKAPAAKKQKLAHDLDVHTTSVALDCSQSDLSKGQLAYSMLYLCQNIIMCQRQAGTHLEDQSHMAGFCLLALELSRHRTTADRGSMIVTEHNWILKLETSIYEYLCGSPECAREAIVLYIKAMRTVGSSFYDSCYPLVLLDLLLYLALRNEDIKTTYKDDLIHICADFILDSKEPLQAFTLPNTSSFDDLMATLTGSGDRGNRRHRDFALKKYHVLSETFFSLLDTEKNDHVTLALKVLDHIEGFHSSLIQMTTKDLRMHMTKLQVNSQLMEGSLKILIQSIKSYDRTYLTSDESYSREQDLSFILTLVTKLGLSCLKMFGVQWYNYLKCSDVKRIIQVLSKDIKESSTVPKEVVALIMQYFSAQQAHDDSACDLLDFFKHGDSHYKKAVKTMCENATFFSVNAMFQLAQKEVTSTVKGGGVGGKGSNMTDDAFVIIEKAVENLDRALPSLISGLTYVHLDWAYKMCGGTGGKDKSKRHYFPQLVDLLSKHAKNHPLVLIRALEFAEKTQSLLKQAAPLGAALVQSYQTHFTQRLQECGHAAYGNVISEMQKARLQCKQYNKDGDKKFDQEVISHVRSHHSGKKKLLKMLDLEFSDKST